MQKLGFVCAEKKSCGVEVVGGKKRFAAGMGAGRVLAGREAGMGPIAPVCICVTMSRLGVYSGGWQKVGPDLWCGSGVKHVFADS